MTAFARAQRFVRMALSMAALACFLPLYLAASTVQVVPGVGATPCIANLASYASISDAVMNVPAGSTIKICPGTYAEQVVITKHLTLIGESGNGLSGSTASGSNNPVVVSPAGGVGLNATDLFTGQPIGAQILVSNATVSISNVAVDGTNNNVYNEGNGGCYNNIVGILYQNASGTLDHVVTRFQELPTDLFGCQDGLAIFAQSTAASISAGPTMTIENSSVHDYDKNGITVVGDMTVTITGNYVVGVGATSLIAQNGIQVSYGATGTVENNTVTDDVYINPSDCYNSNPNLNSCASATGILLYDSGGARATPVTVSGNTVSNTQGAIVAEADPSSTADWNNVHNNKITTTPAIVVTGYTYFLDGIDLCSNNDTATSNTVFNSAGAGVHLDSSCSEGGSPTGLSSSATSNTVNEACAGVLLGNSGGSASATLTYNVVATTYAGDACPAGAPNSAKTAGGRVRPQPLRH